MKGATGLPNVSIIVPFYNCPYIQQALESLLNQTYQDIEIIVVNDGSNQYTELLEPYLGRIRYFEKENGGTASALNLGIKQATGNYFCWLSSDDRFVENKIEMQLQFMNLSNATISYTPAEIINHFSHTVQNYFNVTYKNRHEFLKGLMRGCTINGCSVMMKMDVFSQIGLFDEELMYTHDYEFWLRAVQTYDFYYLNEPLVQYRVHERMGSKKHEKEIMAELKFLRRKYKNNLNNMIMKEQRG